MPARLIASAGLVLVVVGFRSARDAPALDHYTITWAPDRPLEGSLVRVTLTPGSGTADAMPAVRATLAGEPLHFEPAAGGAWTAVAAIPLGQSQRARLMLAATPTAVHDSVISIPVAARIPDVARLRVADRFVRLPDSALAARIAREQRLVRGVLRASHERPRLWQEEFVQPRTSRITSPFGQGRELNADSSVRWHRGTDLDGDRGAPVHAANRGVVALVADLYYAGTAVYLDHGAGLVTSYLHLQRADVAPGDTVASGQVIGRVGATGRVTGPHLHWAAHYGRVAFDPLDLLSLRAPAGL